MNITDIKTEFGAYYINSGQNVARIYMQLFRPFMTQEIMTPFITDDTVYRASEARMTRIIQPFQKAWTPLGSAVFKPVAIEQFKMKGDLQEYPDDLEGTWLGFLASESLNRKEWPFVRWFVEKLVIPQMQQDIEMYEIYGGVYAAPTAGTAGAAGTSMNGIKKAITDNITAGRIIPIVTGAAAADDADWVTQVEDFADAINTLYWMIPMTLAMNQTLERRFHRGYQKKYGKDTNYKEAKGQVDFTNLTVKGLASMNGSNRIWCTPPANILKLGKKTGNMKKLEIESIDRMVKLFTDFYLGAGFIIPEIVFVNDQA